MRKSLFVLFVLLATCVLALAQDSPKAEVFGGYSYGRIDTNGGGGLNLNGWNASATAYMRKNFGITADFGGVYGTPSGVSTKVHTYMFGPTFAMPSDKFTVFAHALFGGAHANASLDSLSGSDNSFAMAYGGGLDANLNKRFAVRVAQVDYVYTRFSSIAQNNFRYSGGVVFKF